MSDAADRTEKLNKLWTQVVGEVRRRQEALQQLGYKGAESTNQEFVVVNLFVEKAGILLQRRARSNFWLGATCLALGLMVAFLFIAFAFVVYDHNVYYAVARNVLGETLPPPTPQGTPTAGEVFLIALRIGGLSAAALGSAAVLVHLARSFFHEWTKLHNQVHAIRFGRLAVYLKRQDLSPTELLEVFAWNIDSSSGFMRRADNPFKNQVVEAMIAAGALGQTRKEP